MRYRATCLKFTLQSAKNNNKILNCEVVYTGVYAVSLKYSGYTVNLTIQHMIVTETYVCSFQYIDMYMDSAPIQLRK